MFRSDATAIESRKQRVGSGNDSLKCGPLYQACAHGKEMSFPGNVFQIKQKESLEWGGKRRSWIYISCDKGERWSAGKKKRFHYSCDSYKTAAVWSSLCRQDWCNKDWPWLGAGVGDVCMSISLLNGPRFVALIYMEAQYQTGRRHKSTATLGVISGLYSTIVPCF